MKNRMPAGKLAVSALGFLLGTGLLGACGNLPAPQEREYVMTVRSVEFPRTAAPTGPLTVTVEVEFGGCQTFKELRATRTEFKLTLQAIGTEKYGPGVNCAAYLGRSKEQYVDAGAPPRTSPFEIVVNDKSWGTVEVK